ncbi:MAG: tRNA uridine-5-carboxymethylaminomethyl(34) synthesis GTPase MnmE [Lentimicrobiaceae bacterium]|nr:tRNA uridine-5-carboxymethylaminomethyl(34) synthesis GTPase MnmE [Lentimicrobiaceae bacterium]
MKNKKNEKRQMNDTICALSTPAGMGAIALIRVCGEKAFSIVNQCFKQKRDTDFEHRKVYVKPFYDGEKVLDQVVVSCFLSPHSFTGENMVEISCHGSSYIQKRIVEVLISRGCRMAKAGEFTLRAFLHGKIDLSQAEAVADVIASESAASHRLAMDNLRGGFSQKIRQLRKQLLHFVALLELELDFGEEDVEFANRKQMRLLMNDLHKEIQQLLSSFQMGNAVKNGIPVAIVGIPNVGKSTLLNALLQEERAIVSPIAGTTRDTIEDRIVLNGCLFRFIDTAGIRKSSDEIEHLGIERTFQSIQKAMIVLYLIDVSHTTHKEIDNQIDTLLKQFDFSDKKMIIIANKSDLLPRTSLPNSCRGFDIIKISAKQQENMDSLLQKLQDFVSNSTSESQVVVSNIRHYEALNQAMQALQQAEESFDAELSQDIVALDIHRILHHLSEVIGEVSNEDILGEIFSRFCIGK